MLLMVAAAVAPAADGRARQMMKGVTEIVEGGRYEHALRILDNHLAVYPDEPEVLALRREVEAAAARAAGNSTLKVVAGVRLPRVENDQPEPGKNFTAPRVGIGMIWVEPGSFLMSNPLGSDDDTFVTHSRGYWLGRTEVTQEQLQSVMEHLPPQSYFRGSDRPAERITWVSAMDFGRILTERERVAGRLPPDYEYTLPTEAQWEYACRAGSTGSRASDIPAVAWFEHNSDRQTHPVAQRQPNAWGFYDMHGNVAEWCRDGLHGYPGGRVTDLMIGYDGPSAAMSRMIRGGGWNNTAGQCQFGVRYAYVLNYAGPALGFRLALVPVRSGTPATQTPLTVPSK